MEGRRRRREGDALEVAMANLGLRNPNISSKGGVLVSLLEERVGGVKRKSARVEKGKEDVGKGFGDVDMACKPKKEKREMQRKEEGRGKDKTQFFIE